MSKGNFSELKFSFFSSPLLRIEWEFPYFKFPSLFSLNETEIGFQPKTVSTCCCPMRTLRGFHSVSIFDISSNIKKFAVLLCARHRCELWRCLRMCCGEQGEQGYSEWDGGKMMTRRAIQPAQESLHEVSEKKSFFFCLHEKYPFSHISQILLFSPSSLPQHTFAYFHVNIQLLVEAAAMIKWVKNRHDQKCSRCVLIHFSVIC